MNKPVAVYGAGGHGVCILDIAKSQGVRIAAFVDDNRPEGKRSFHRIPLLTPYEVGDVSAYDFIVAIGDSATRARISTRLTEHGATFAAPLVHSSARVQMGTTLARGVVIFPNAVIGPLCNVEEGVHVLNGVTVSHHALLAPYTTLCDGARIGGKVTCGSAAYVGLGACVLPGVGIGSFATIGAGSVVTKNVNHHAVAYGVPARTKRYTA